MQTVRKLLIPNKLDATFLVGCLLIVVSCVNWWYFRFVLWSNEELFVAVSVFNGIVLAAVASCMAWGAFHKFRSFSLMVVAFLSLFVPPLLIRFINPGTFLKNGNLWWNGEVDYQAYALESSNTALVYAAAAAVVFLATLLLILLFRFGTVWITRLVKMIGGKAASKFELTRAKVLIATALFLFVLAMVNNVLIANGVDLFRQGNDFAWLDIPINIFLSVIGIVVFVVFPTWCLLRSKQWWWKWIGGLMVIGVPTAIGITASSNLMPSLAWVPISIGALAGLLFQSTVFSLKRSLSADATENSNGSRSFLSMWSTLSVVLVVGMFLSPWFIDYQLMIPNGQTSFESNFRSAIASATLRRQSNEQLSGSEELGFFGKFSPETDSDVLKYIPKSTVPTNLMLLGLHPHIETSMIRERAKAVWIKGGTLTSSQLEDLMNNTVGTIYWLDFDVKESEQKAIINSNAAIYISSEKPGDVGRMLSVVEKFTNQKQQVHLGIGNSSALAPDDWPAIVKASQTSSIVISSSLPESLTKTEEISGMSLKNIKIVIGGYREISDQIGASLFELMRDTDINLELNVFHLYGQKVFDLTFAIPGRSDWREFAFHNLEGNERNWHLAYGFDEQDRITHLFLPGGEETASVNRYRELRSLSFDAGWLRNDDTIVTTVVDQPTSLQNLTKLEELYFSDCELSILDLSFIEHLRSLKHLQISAIDRNRGGPVGFDSLANLESLTLFGVPDKSTVAELKQLPKLEKLVVVDVLNDWKTAAIIDKQKQQLKSLLNGVDVQVIPFGDGKPKPPVKFREHLKKKSAEIFAKLEQEQEEKQGTPK